MMRVSFPSRPSLSAASALALFLAIAGCGVDERPSILLVVIDTLRADAVSAYGRVEGTTPHFDRLAAEGLLYTRAYAPAPWTLPSHASLFTGLPVERHRVGLEGWMALAQDADTLAEKLARAGYRTAGFSENPLVSGLFGMDQGFGHYATNSLEDNAAEQFLDEKRFFVEEEVERWARGQGRRQPWFVFVNLYDPHDPYEVREQNPFLPEDASAAWAREIERRPKGLCDALPPEKELGVVTGLYLGDVRAADATLGRVLATLEAIDPDRKWIHIVTADHGEHLGEHRILGHEFSVRGPVLHVPLVVHGLPGAPAARIETPVELVDVTHSILAWTGLEESGAQAGLPEAPGAANGERPLFAVYEDTPLVQPDTFPPGHALVATALDEKRAGCGEEDRVFGDTLALTRFPFKLIWFERHDPELYDLSWDERELSDLAGRRPRIVAELRAELEAFREEKLAVGGDGAPPELAPEAVQELRDLGYTR